MSEGDFMYVDTSKESYQKIINLDGVRTTVCENRFEVTTSPHAEINEQVAVQTLKDWLKWRRQQAQLREPSSVSE